MMSLAWTALAAAYLAVASLLLWWTRRERERPLWREALFALAWPLVLTTAIVGTVLIVVYVWATRQAPEAGE